MSAAVLERSAEIPQSYFDFHKFGVITAEASELKSFDFLSRLPRGDTGFWMKTRNSKVLFILDKAEPKDGGEIASWRFLSSGWTPRGRQVGLTIYND